MCETSLAHMGFAAWEKVSLAGFCQGLSFILHQALLHIVHNGQKGGIVGNHNIIC